MIFIFLFNSPFFKIMHCRIFNGNQIKRKKTQILIFYFGLFFLKDFYNSILHKITFKQVIIDSDIQQSFEIS